MTTPPSNEHQRALGRRARPPSQFGRAESAPGRVCPVPSNTRGAAATSGCELAVCSTALLDGIANVIECCTNLGCGSVEGLAGRELGVRRTKAEPEAVAREPREDV